MKNIRIHDFIRKQYRKIKMFFLRKKYRLKNVHKTFYIGGKSFISRDLHAEKYVYIGPNCIIYPNVRIGAYSMLANDVKIQGGDHLYCKVGTPVIFSGRDTIKETVIGRDVWIGTGSFIKVGVKIGDATIVAAASVVIKDLEPCSIYGGNPARKIRSRFETDSDKEKHLHMLHINEMTFDCNMLPKSLQ